MAAMAAMAAMVLWTVNTVSFTVLPVPQVQQVKHRNSPSACPRSTLPERMNGLRMEASN